MQAVDDPAALLESPTITARAEHVVRNRAAMAVCLFLSYKSDWLLVRSLRRKGGACISRRDDLTRPKCGPVCDV
jgi:hypothetical protein